MESIIYLDELSQKEETLLDKILSVSNIMSNFIIGISAYLDLKIMFRFLKMLANSFDKCDFTSVPKKNLKEIHDKLELLLLKSEKIQENLIEIIKAYPQPLLKISLRDLKKFNNILLDILDEVKIALNQKFFTAMEKVVEGIEKVDFDISRVKKVESFL